MTLRAVPAFKPTMRDYELEGEMCRILREYKAAKSRAIKRLLWDQYRKLHVRRSPGMIAYLEGQKGLR